jgi:methyl-accepting chemotaxis protein
MGQMDQVTQRTASAAEELSSTAAEMAAQAESVQQLLAYFQVRRAAEPGVERPSASPAPRPAAAWPQPAVRQPAPAASAGKDGDGLAAPAWLAAGAAGRQA